MPFHLPPLLWILAITLWIVSDESTVSVVVFLAFTKICMPQARHQVPDALSGCSQPKQPSCT
jgi:uncharacterized membrane protein YwaF